MAATTLTYLVLIFDLPTPQKQLKKKKFDGLIQVVSTILLYAIKQKK